MKDTLEGIEYSKFDRSELIFSFDKQSMYDSVKTEEANAAD